jgi:DNA invertase Pin-like site-specific DNA recombinase
MHPRWRWQREATMGEHSGKYVAYYRVSTERQGVSGLGLDAQRDAVARYLNGGAWQMVAEFVEVESGKRSNNRPQLQAALAAARKARATLLVAKLDRLSRNVHFLSGLLESKVRFRLCDMPEADKTQVQMLAVFAEWEARRISERTKSALAAKKARGDKLGNAHLLVPGNALAKEQAKERADALRATLQGFQRQGMTHREMVEELNRAGVPAARGGAWGLVQLQRVLRRLGM